MKNSTRTIITKDFTEKGVLSTLEYLNILKNLKVVKNFTKYEKEDAFLENPRSFFSKITDFFSVRYHLEQKIIRDSELLNERIVNNHPIFGNNINDPIIDEEYIENLFVGENLDSLINQISLQYRSTEYQNLIIKEYHDHLKNMFNALNGDQVDAFFIKNEFRKFYSKTKIFNGQIRGQRIRHDILMFQQAFTKNPKKFEHIDDFIPVNLGSSVEVVGIAEPKIVCHSIGSVVTADSLKYAHEILISRAASSKFNIKLFVKLDQDDSEVQEVLSFFSKIGVSTQFNTDVSLLDEENMTFSDWDIKNEYLKLSIPRKFAQQIVQLGNFVDEKIKSDFEEKFILESLRDLEKKINSCTIEERALLIKRHNELVSYFFSRDPLLLVPSGNKSFFFSLKVFIDLTSYK